MQAIFQVTFPFFALVLVGYLAAQKRLISEAAIPGLNAYVLYFALPCMLIVFCASQPFEVLMQPAWLGLYLSCAALIVAFTIMKSRLLGLNLKDASFGAVLAAFPNTGFVGLPLLVSLFGDRAAAPVILVLLADVLITTSVCVAIAQMQTGGRGPLASLSQSLRGMLSNPIAWSVVIGGTISATDATIPAPVMQVAQFLAESATPMSLFTIGAVLWRANQNAQSQTPMRHVLPVVAIKLLLHPLIVLGAGLALRAAGVQIDNFVLGVLVMAAALPSGTGVSVLAERHGADNGRIARIILTSTALAFLSFSMVVAVVSRNIT